LQICKFQTMAPGYEGQCCTDLPHKNMDVTGSGFVAANPTVQCGAGVIRSLQPLGPAIVAANPTVQCGAGIRCLQPLGPAFVAVNPTVQCDSGIRCLRPLGPTFVAANPGRPCSVCNGRHVDTHWMTEWCQQVKGRKRWRGCDEVVLCDERARRGARSCWR
jgi:hypothetical protein